MLLWKHKKGKQFLHLYIIGYMLVLAISSSVNVKDWYVFFLFKWILKKKALLVCTSLYTKYAVDYYTPDSTPIRWITAIMLWSLWDQTPGTETIGTIALNLALCHLEGESLQKSLLFYFIIQFYWFYQWGDLPWDPPFYIYTTWLFKTDVICYK